ncbi:5-methyltetrahydropteroyltriglutamate--homocysteine S-methyltransferase [Pseudorhodoplanes sp.]|uniref:5-methyltetrahydropteroyltriglutamate-- homocysteine S-methyltransferase n=1 Tax=Pseudorhodoplanes sp. TaxID=1934341 RepID=UPI002BDCE2FA|nr:5-methyltetrahydropteroyltriglutamate--homocysteine S-methyltransferase [Pseudorhodoplanes sp.]HWV55500.1 5-methyltetrahydropteroyltriglutamate--homocysteine S-methyltransferase [Pseudorhodoplanes sp.]
MSSRLKPPFRADQVGSLLRPESLKEARRQFAEGKISAADLKEKEDKAILEAIRGQEEIGLQGITDGEFRREAWQTDFLSHLDGVEAGLAQLPMPGGKVESFRVAKVVGPVGFSSHPMIDHFSYVAKHTTRTPKMTIPSPTMMVSLMRDWRGIVSADAYDNIDDLYRDLGAAYRGAIRAFYDAGCRYIQLDDCNLAFMCDPERRQAMESRGDKPAQVLGRFAELINSALEGRPDDLTVSMHLCRGNLRSNWMAKGGYEFVADTLFNKINVDALFLEYDSERAGGFDPLRVASSNGGPLIVLGLVTTKSGQLEDREMVKHRIDEAARYVGLERLCLSPQCGFASTEEGNLLSEDEQWRKLALTQQIAADVWH